METYPALRNRTAIVTGAASGLGAATASVLASSGARVALLARRADALNALVADVEENAIAVPADVTDDAAVDAASSRIRASFGSVDLVVNAAGIMLPNPVTEAPAEEWERMIRTNLEGGLHVLRAFTADPLAAAQAGAPADLVFISSVAAHQPPAELSFYNATKAAVTHLVASQCQELGPKNVRLSSVEPGLTRTELGSHITNAAHAEQLEAVAGLPMLESSDVADLIGFLTSRPSSVNLHHSTLVPTSQG